MSEHQPDFHVVSLTYSLKANDRISYESPTPLEFETDDVQYRLADGKLQCELKVHAATASDAQAIVEPLLKSWEAHADLSRSPGELEFQFEGAVIVDRAPAPAHVNSARSIALLGELVLTAVGTVTVQITYSDYPQPPGHFRLNPDAESLLVRYRGYLRNREPLAAMAYFCLTLIESNGPGRRLASRRYKMDERVLRKLGELTSQRGDRLTGRKAAATPGTPLAGSEASWVEAAVKAIILRVGDIRSGVALPLITMADLPPL